MSPLLDPDNRLPVAERSRAFGNTVVEAPRSIARNGTFLVIRQLEQNVRAFNKYCKDEADRLATRLPQPYEMNEEFIAAKLVGRWRDGSSLVRNPYYPFQREQEKRDERHEKRPTAADFQTKDKDDTAAALAASGQPLGGELARPESNPAAGTPIPAAIEAPSPKQTAEKARKFYGDNDFLFGVEDPQALRCPFGAHIRRSNPRDSLEPGSMEQVSISNRHRIFRIGRLYQQQGDDDPGLLFMCLNGDIERQFEFVQQTWLVSPAFHGLAGEQDPFNSDGEGPRACCFMVPSHDGPVRLNRLPRFVKTLGGGYFFMPGRALLAFLGGV